MSAGRVRSRTVLRLAASLQATTAPKKLLVVTVTTGFRHSSIETAEKVLAELGASSGAWTVDYVHQPEGQPKNPGKPPEKTNNFYRAGFYKIDRKSVV